MPSNRELAKERRIRRLADEHGYRLAKSRADGTYGLRDLRDDDWVTWTDHGTHGWSLDAIEGWLMSTIEHSDETRATTA